VNIPAGSGQIAKTKHSINPVGPEDLGELLPLMRAYCGFYNVSPTGADLLALAKALIHDPQFDGPAVRVAGVAS
jgi:hypothetical protein